MLETKKGARYLSFQGIRYAQPPTGDLRFKRPFQYEAQEELYDVSATSDIKCLQFSFDKEDKVRIVSSLMFMYQVGLPL